MATTMGVSYACADTDGSLAGDRVSETMTNVKHNPTA